MERIGFKEEAVRMMHHFSLPYPFDHLVILLRPVVGLDFDYEITVVYEGGMSFEAANNTRLNTMLPLSYWYL